MAAPALVLETTSDWDAIEAAWTRCAAALRGAGLRDAEVAVLAMVARELLENAVKYAYPSNGASIELTLRVDGAEVTLSVLNPIAPGDEHGDRVRAAIAWIRSFPDPLDAYAEVIAQVSRQQRAGGVGLARIAAEGACELFAAVAERSVLISAVRRRKARP